MATASASGSPISFKVLDLSGLPAGWTSLQKKDRDALYQKVTETYVGAVPPNVLNRQASITLIEEIIAISWYSLTLGTPFAIPVVFTLLLVFGAPYGYYAAFTLLLVGLVLVPIPNPSEALWTSYFMQCLYRYSSFKVVWATNDEAFMKEARSSAMIGSGGPHGVMPVGALLSIAAMNEVLGIPFTGSGASVIFKVPGLRFQTMMGIVDVSKKSIIRTIKEKGLTVGVVSDGIKGMFKATTSKDNVEVMAIKNSKGVSKIALQMGVGVGVVHWFGNSAALVPIVDGFGVCQALSRKFRMSLMLFRGRFWCTPLPTRQPIVMAIGTGFLPIPADKKSEGVPDAPPPSQAAIDAAHEKVLAAHRRLFEQHRSAFGWGQKELVFV